MQFLSVLLLLLPFFALAKDNQKGDGAGGQCRKMARIEHLQTIAANQTLLDKVSGGNTTRADEIKAKAQAGQKDLDTIRSNSTLLQACAARKTKRTCKGMTKLEKAVKLATNDTALAAAFEGNQTKIEKFKAKAPKLQAKLAELQGNSTLMGICKDLAAQRGQNGGNGNGGDSQPAQNGISSDAMAVRMSGALSLAAIAASVFGMLML